jgi:hypothetical protein
MDTLHINVGVELFGEERKNGGDSSDEHGSPKGSKQFLAVLHDENDEIVARNVVLSQGVGGGYGRLPKLGAAVGVAAAVFSHENQSHFIRLALGSLPDWLND